MLGISGHGLPALGMRLLNGEAWLVNEANHSISLIDGYSGQSSTQVGLPGMGTDLQLANTPDGAVITDQNGHLIKVFNDNFSTSNPIELFGGSASTAAAGQNSLYAVDQATGQVQQLDALSPQLTPIGPQISVGAPVATPVVAADGSLYVAIRNSGSVGHISNGHLALIRGVGHRGDSLSLVLAGAQVVAADLTTDVIARLSGTAVSGPRVHLPAGFGAIQVTGSDTQNGLVGLVSAHAVDSVNMTTGGVSSTPLPYAVNPSAAAMQGNNVVLIDSTLRQVLVVDTATRSIVRTLTMPGTQMPDQLTVRDRLVFVNASDGASALVINASGAAKTVTKYTGPPPVHPQPAKLPTVTKTPTAPTPAKVHHGPPQRPGAPLSPVATPGNAAVTVGWGAAPANGSAVQQYLLSWTGSNGSAGHATLPGGALGKIVSGLSNGVPYTFTVAAVNGIGEGPSVKTAPVTPSSEVPDAPTGLTAVAAQPDGSVSLKWSSADNGYHIASYTIWETGSTVPLEKDVTSTTANIGETQGLTVGAPTQFQVSAIGTSGDSSPLSTSSMAVTPFLAPAAPTVQVTSYAPAGTSATLTVTCPSACQQGRPAKTYQVTLSPSAPPVSAPASPGGTTVVPVNGLTPDGAYTASVTVTDTAGIAGAADITPLSTPGPPSVSNVTVTGNGQAVNVTANVLDGGGGGLPTTCQVSVSGGGSASGPCDGAITVGVPTYNTSYGVTYTATNADGSASGTGSGNSGLKLLIANATDSFGTCTGSPPPKYCGGDSNMEPTPNFVAGNGAPPVPEGTQEMAGCWTTGGYDKGTVPPYTNTNQWVEMPGQGYMSILWFPNPGSVTAGLPGC
jgi:hypothetical protein